VTRYVASTMLCVSLLAVQIGLAPDSAAGASRAVPAKAAVTPFVDFQNSSPIRTAVELSLSVPQIRNLVCPKSRVNGEPALGVALSDAARFVDQNSTLAARRSLENSPLTSTKRRAEAEGAAGWADGKPQAALDAFLRAHSLDKNDPLPFLDASASLTALGKPRDGLALADAAAKLKDPAHPPLGIDVVAIALNDRGNALLSLGRYKEAIDALSAAVGRAPMLSEADANLAAARLCSGEPSPAGKLLAAGARRGHFKEVPNAVPPPGRQTKPAAGDVFDLSHGKKAKIAALPITPRPSLSPGYYAFYHQLLQKYEDQLLATSADLSKLSNASQNRKHPLNAVTAQRTSDILSYISNAGPDPALESLLLVLDNAGKAANNVVSSWDPYQACWGAKHHDQFAKSLGAYDQAMRKYEAEFYSYATGLEANLSDPISHAMARDYVQLSEINWSIAVLLPADSFENMESHQKACFTREDVTVNPPPSLPNGKAPPCPNQIFKVINALASLIHGISLTGDCEKFEAEITSPGPLGLFGRISVNRAGEVSIFAGPHAHVSVPIIGSATLQDGIYVRFTSSGQISDAGGRIEYSGHFGNADFGDKMDFSVAGVNPIVTAVGR
jgi:tetratricopeptide (TPR) repeat protein